MPDNDTKRLSRLTSILLQLQSKRLVTATGLAEKFGVSVRTIYRDIRALESSGVPVLTEDGKGYTLMDGYRIPPVSFTQSEANALITAQKLLAGNSDASLVSELGIAIEKIKAVLRYETRDGAELLESRMAVAGATVPENQSDYLTRIQQALTSYWLLQINYLKEGADVALSRQVEPFALLTTQGKWLLLAYCRMRQQFRLFRLDRIRDLRILTERFEPHNMTLQEYFEKTEGRL